jgi:hypothetical protein
MSGYETIIEQYFDTWNEADADRRLNLAEKVWTDDSRYVDPVSDVQGPAGFADMVGTIQGHYPGHKVRLTSGIDSHHDQLRFEWDIVAPDGTVAFTGIDVAAVAEDGRLRSIAGFLGPVPAGEAP